MIITGLRILWPHESEIDLKSLFYGVIKGSSCNNGNHLLNIPSGQALIHASHMFYEPGLRIWEEKADHECQTSFNCIFAFEPESKCFFNISEWEISILRHTSMLILSDTFDICCKCSTRPETF